MTGENLKPKNETELAKYVVEWLDAQHWDVYQEVQFHSSGGIADIAAVRDSKLWIIECKNTLSIAVLEQAWRWQSHFRSIAIPPIRGDRSFAYRLAHDLRIGVLVVDGSYITEKLCPPLMREFHSTSKRFIRELLPEHKTFLAAGSSGGGYVTPYKITMDQIRRFIRSNPGCTLKDIMEDIGRAHYSNIQSAKSCVRTALSNWETWCKIETDGKQIRYFSVK